MPNLIFGSGDELMVDESQIISSYPWQQGVEDGILVKLFEDRWPDLTRGVPLLVTRAIYEAFSLAACQEIWNEFAVWRRDVMPKLREEDRMFETKMNEQKVWLIEDGVTFTILFPSDY